jgi:hypothetical protein
MNGREWKLWWAWWLVIAAIAISISLISKFQNK